MSYDIALFRIETKEKEENSNDDNFFDTETNFLPFSLEQFQGLQNRLLDYEYVLSKEDDLGLHFAQEDEDFGLVVLTRNALFFTASWNENSIFGVGMIASEFTDTGEFAKYDFQNGAWEIWE